MIMKALKVPPGHSREMCTDPVELSDSSIAAHIPINIQRCRKMNRPGIATNHASRAFQKRHQFAKVAAVNKRCGTAA